MDILVVSVDVLPVTLVTFIRGIIYTSLTTSLVDNQIQI